MYSTRAPDFALLVCTTICLFAGACKEDDAGPPTSPHQEIIGKLPSFPEGSGVIEYDHWYRAWLQGRPTGSHRVTVRTYPTEEGSLRLAETKTRMTMRIGTEVSRMAFEERILVDEKHRLLRLVSTEHEAGAEPVAVRAGKLGDQMVTVRGPEIRKVPWDATSVNTKSYGVFFPDHPPRKGEVKNSRTYNTEQGAYCDVRMEVVEVSAAEKTYTLEQTSPSLPGAVTRVKLDEKLEPLDVEMRMGSLTIRFERVAEQPRSADIEAWVPDLSSLTTIPVDVDWKSPHQPARARYRLKGLPDHVDRSWLTGPGQRVIEAPSKGAFVIEVARQSAPDKVAFPPPANEVPGEYLASTALCRTDDEKIVELAKKAVADAEDAWDAAKRLRAFVSREIDGSRGMSFGSASDTIRSAEGDCSEQSVLLAAMARAVGIPARCVMGLVYTNGSFSRHMWTEVWVGRWQPLDAAMQSDVIGGGWIRLGEHSLQMTADARKGLGGLTAFAADISIEVLDDRTKEVVSGEN